MSREKRVLKLEVLAPCTEDWNGMSGNDAVRFCSRCSQNVYNLSAMAAAEVRALVEGPRVCVRFFTRGDGTVVTRSCAPMLQAARRRLVALAAGLGPLAVGFWGSIAWVRGLVGGGVVQGGRRRPDHSGGGDSPPSPLPQPMIGEPAPFAPARPDAPDVRPEAPRRPGQRPTRRQRRKALMEKPSPALMGEMLLTK